MVWSRFLDKQAVAWSKQVKERDNYICQACGKYGVSLNSHHKYNWADFISFRYDLNNGVTLCTTCHDLYHQIYGKKLNTHFEFLQFKKIIDAFKDAIRKENKKDDSSEER